ncbi:hypothetical protein EDC96DRAFT_480121 [Choanephora cucurbitarum]|nr:hypothetical protein EDC96DRAFT_480121 [Choanephora cucurbitarum]
MSIQRKKKPVEFHFVDMNDPERYKKLKVARACDFCRRRKSKCDIGIPGSGTCSNCQKHKTVCIFSPVTPNRATELIRQEIPKLQVHALSEFPLLSIEFGQAGYERDQPDHQQHSYIESPNPTSQEPSLAFESQLFQVYFDYVHPVFPVLLEQSVKHIHSQDQMLLPRALRYAIMALACHFLPHPSASFTPGLMTDKWHHHNTALYFYKEAVKEIDRGRSSGFHPARLDIAQALLLLYKYQEMVQQSVQGIQHLEDAQHILCRIQATIPQQQEMLIRVRWVVISCIYLGNLSNKRLSQLYNRVQLPDELPKALSEEMEDSNTPASVTLQRINQFDQLLNLSLLYSHTIQTLMIGSTSELICLYQFKSIRQHWYSTLHPITQNQLLSLSTFDQQDMDNTTLYSAILYDMLYLLLLQHYRLPETEWDSIEAAYRLQRMIHTWTMQASFKSAIQSQRMASFGLILCLNTHLSKEDQRSIDVSVIDQIRHTMTYTQIDSRLDRELEELYIKMSSKRVAQPSQPIDYFSVAPQHTLHSAASSPFDYPLPSTPGLGDMLSTTTTTVEGLNTPIREEDNPILGQQTAEWIAEQQRQQHLQFQAYQSQQSYAFPALFIHTPLSSSSEQESPNCI